MVDLNVHLLGLIRLAATDLPAAVEDDLRQALARETDGSAARAALEAIVENVVLARRASTPLCQDTGTPSFYIRHPAEFSTVWLRGQIRQAVAEATRLAYLRPNAVDALSGINSGNNLGDETFPALYFEQGEGEALSIDLLLKGGGCENVSAQYSLPDEHLAAGRDLEGVRRVALDAVHRTQGLGCAPGYLGIAFGGDRGASYLAAKRALLRPPHLANPNPELAELENCITSQANLLGIGPMGFGGKTTLLGTRITALTRLPASFFVSISYMCWAFRWRRLVLTGGEARYG